MRMTDSTRSLKSVRHDILILIKAQSIILILIALLSSFSITGQCEEGMRYTLIGLSIIALGIIIFQQSKNYMNGWQNARFIAESVLSNAWLFGFKVWHYSGNEKVSTNNFIENVTKIEMKSS
jgi:hypothetical protein